MSQNPGRLEASVVVAATAERVFAFLDDQQNLSAHMSKPSGRMWHVHDNLDGP